MSGQARTRSGHWPCRRHQSIAGVCTSIVSLLPVAKSFISSLFVNTTATAPRVLASLRRQWTWRHNQTPRPFLYTQHSTVTANCTTTLLTSLQILLLQLYANCERTNSIRHIFFNIASFKRILLVLNILNKKLISSKLRLEIPVKHLIIKGVRLTIKYKIINLFCLTKCF